ncbi:FkbM family methyltransferase [Mucisphaera sp.]|uniref:FkbM family methyltransferase n=1 Tax=Mucisphaera sp. TaxID=2913024 RepID=UPI003D0B1237
MVAEGLRVRLSRWLLPKLSPVRVPRPVPGWYLGFGECRRDAVHRVRRGLLRSFKQTARLTWIDGLQVVAYPYNEVTRSLMMTGLYDPTELFYLRRTLKPGMTFIDAGANLGLYSLVASRCVGASGRVVALEPSGREFDRLCRHVEINGLENVEPLRLAVSDSEDRIGLKVADEKHAGHNTLGGFAYEATQLDRVESVGSTTIDGLVTGLGLSRVDLIKLDIEGAELAALRGAVMTLKRFRPAILLEFAEKSLEAQGASSAAVWDLLAAHGYAMASIDNVRGEPMVVKRRDRYDVSVNLLARPRELAVRCAA